MEALVRNTRPLSTSRGCPQSISTQDGGHEDQDPDDRHSRSSSPFKPNPWSHLKLALPPILNVVRTMDPLAGGDRFLQSVSTQVGAVGSHWFFEPQMSLADPRKKEMTGLEHRQWQQIGLIVPASLLKAPFQAYDN